MDKKKLADRLIQQAKNNELRKSDKSIPKITNEEICLEFNIGKDKLNFLKNHDEEIKAIIADLSKDKVSSDKFSQLDDRNFQSLQKLQEEAEKDPVNNYKALIEIRKALAEEKKRRGPEQNAEKKEANEALLEHGLTPQMLATIIGDPAFAVFCVENKEKIEGKAKELGWNSKSDSSSS